MGFENRFKKAVSNLSNNLSIKSTCEAVLSEAIDRNQQRIDAFSLSDSEWFRIQALNYLVWAGDVTDQTHGAIACHRHDIDPFWAKNRTPTALLGSFLFFR